MRIVPPSWAAHRQGLAQAVKSGAARRRPNSARVNGAALGSGSPRAMPPSLPDAPAPHQNDWLAARRRLADPRRARSAYAQILFAMTVAAALAGSRSRRAASTAPASRSGPTFSASGLPRRSRSAGTRPRSTTSRPITPRRRALFPRDAGYVAFFYPPPFLLLCLPLAALPYFWSLAAWLAATGFACWRVLRAWLGRDYGTLPILAFPAMLSNLGHGQNAFLSTALFGGGALLLNARPFVAGLCLGALVYKPHLEIVIPVALIAARRWRTVLGAAVSAAGSASPRSPPSGSTAWKAFLAASPLARAALERNMVGDEKMQSVFAAVRLLHGGLTLAWGCRSSRRSASARRWSCSSAGRSARPPRGRR